MTCHRLHKEWVLYFEKGGDRKQRGLSSESYELDLLEICTARTVEEFWKLIETMKHYAPLHSFPFGSGAHLMQRGKKPTWESVAGGDVVYSVLHPGRRANRKRIQELFENASMAAVSGHFDDHIVGVTYSMRWNKAIFKIWLSNVSDDKKRLFEETIAKDWGITEKCFDKSWFDCHSI